MPEQFIVLLDQNVPLDVAAWLKMKKPNWLVFHAKEESLDKKSDLELFNWALDHEAAIITFDEDFADQRSFPVGTHFGVIRLRVWPTTIEETQNALQRLLDEATDDEIYGSLVIIDRSRIRIRSRKIRSV